MIASLYLRHVRNPRRTTIIPWGQLSPPEFTPRSRKYWRSHCGDSVGEVRLWVYDQQLPGCVPKMRISCYGDCNHAEWFPTWIWVHIPCICILWNRVSTPSIPLGYITLVDWFTVSMVTQILHFLHHICVLAAGIWGNGLRWFLLSMVENSPGSIVKNAKRVRIPGFPTNHFTCKIKAVDWSFCIRYVRRCQGSTRGLQAVFTYMLIASPIEPKCW